MKSFESEGILITQLGCVFPSPPCFVTDLISIDLSFKLSHSHECLTKPLPSIIDTYQLNLFKKVKLDGGLIVPQSNSWSPKLHVLFVFQTPVLTLIMSSTHLIRTTMAPSVLRWVNKRNAISDIHTLIDNM